MEKGGELFFLDEHFEPVEGPVEEYGSAVWSERYFEPGTFTVMVGGSSDDPKETKTVAF